MFGNFCGVDKTSKDRIRMGVLPYVGPFACADVTLFFNKRTDIIFLQVI
jgi:hypothetical protein